ncbi:MAG: EamA family transporter [Thiotrichales bacterium]|nr:EamA family transporter [Thiotrichales bacterium]
MKEIFAPSAARQRGLLIALAGVAAIVPDGLLVRLVETDSWTLVFWRGALSAVAISLGLVVIHRRGSIAHFAAIGGVGLAIAVLFAAGAICFVFAINLTKVANVLFIVSTAPLYAAIYSKVFLKERVPRRVWIAIGLSLIGITLICSSSFSAGNTSLLGDTLALLAAMSLAGTLCLARQARSVSMVPAMAVAGVVYALVALPFAAPLSLDASDVLWLALMGLGSVPLGFSLLTLSARYLPAPEVSLMILLEAVLGPLLVWLVLAEYPGNIALLGGAVVVTTLVVLNLAARRDLSG